MGVWTTAWAPPSFHDLAQIHDHDAAADVLDDGQIVRHKKIGHAALALEVLQQIDDLRLHGNVQGADRLVANDQFGFDRQGAGDADALALAAAEFVRIARGVGGLQADGLEERGDFLPAVARRRLPGDECPGPRR